MPKTPLGNDPFEGLDLKDDSEDSSKKKATGRKPTKKKTTGKSEPKKKTTKKSAAKKPKSSQSKKSEKGTSQKSDTKKTNAKKTSQKKTTKKKTTTKTPSKKKTEKPAKQAENTTDETPEKAENASRAEVVAGAKAKMEKAILDRSKQNGKKAAKGNAAAKKKPANASSQKGKKPKAVDTDKKKATKKSANAQKRKAAKPDDGGDKKASVSKASSPKAEAIPSGETQKAGGRSSLAIGGGAPELLPLLRPEGFDVGQEYGYDPDYHKSLQPIMQFFYRFYWRVKVIGQENLPKEGRAVLVANHAGILPFDGLMLANAIRKEAGRHAWPLIEDFFYYAPVLGHALSKMGCVRACQENAQRLLAEDELVIVFPEGIKGIVKSYRNRYRLQRFGRGGFVKLSLVSKAKVIPVAIVGSEEANPFLGNVSTLAKILGLPYFPITPLFPFLGPFGLAPLPSKWTIIIGEPIDIDTENDADPNDRSVINRISAEVKSHIQKMIDTEIGQRKSRWFG